MAELQKLGGVHGVAKLLICDPAVGIDPSDSSLGSEASRKSLFGANKLPDTPPVSFWYLMVRYRVPIVIPTCSPCRL